MDSKLEQLPEQTKKQLGDLARALSAQLGDNLVSLIVFGSAVRGGWEEGKSDIDLVLVLREPKREALLSISNALSVARMAWRFEAVILAEKELSHAADVFPLFYDDMRGCHALLAGRDVLSDLVISDVHRRIRIEQELREMKIRLRRVVIDVLGEETRLAGPVERKVKQLRGPLHALLALRGTPAGADSLSSVLDKAQAVYKVDTAPLRAVRKAPLTALDALNSLLGHAIEEVDRMEVRS